MKSTRFLILHLLYVQSFYHLTYGSALLTNYLPASMQALAYYIDMLQYEPLSMTTVEPPFTPNIESAETTQSSTASYGSVTTPKTPTTTRPTSQKPPGSTSGWWQPPDWWHPTSTTTTTTTTTTRKPYVPPTPPHKPGLYAPVMLPHFRKPPHKTREGYELFDEIGPNPEGFDPLPLALIRDIQTGAEHDEFTNDVESLDNFLRLYDDNYGQAAFGIDSAMDRWSATSTAGKKRIPPTKPYVEFLLVYDLLKRDAKAENLSKYEGYSEEMLKDLVALSHVSAERQLYTLFKRMLDRHDIQRIDVVLRIQGIQKDLANPNSATVKALRYIPPLSFVP